MKILLLMLNLLILSSVYAQDKVVDNYTDFEKAKMIPDKLNSVMLKCESQCSNSDSYSSESYKGCYKSCVSGQIVTVEEINSREGLTPFEKAKMIPNSLNSMMLMCESDCSKTNKFESKGYQGCYRGCLDGKVSASFELHGCGKHSDGQSISCPDGLYVKSSSINEDLIQNKDSNIKFNGKVKRKSSTAVEH